MVEFLETPTISSGNPLCYITSRGWVGVPVYQFFLPASYTKGDILKDAETKQLAQRQQEMQQQQQMQQQQLQAQAQEKAQEREFQQQQNDAERQKDLMVAEIRAAGYGAQSDINQNQQSDFRDAMKDMTQRDQYREQMDFKREESVQKEALNKSKIEIDREKLNTQRQIAATNLEIARENKNKYDVQSKSKDSE